MQDQATVELINQACVYGPSNIKCLSLWHSSYVVVASNVTDAGIAYNVSQTLKGYV